MMASGGPAIATNPTKDTKTWIKISSTTTSIRIRMATIRSKMGTIKSSSININISRMIRRKCIFKNKRVRRKVMKSRLDHCLSPNRYHLFPNHNKSSNNHPPRCKKSPKPPPMQIQRLNLMTKLLNQKRMKNNQNQRKRKKLKNKKIKNCCRRELRGFL